MERKLDSKFPIATLIAIGLLTFAAVYFLIWQIPEPPPKEEEKGSPVVQKQEEVAKGEELPDHLRHLSALTVRVKTPFAEGSGLLVKRGKQIFIWTAGYLAHDCRGIGEFTTAAWITVPLVRDTDDVPASVIRYGGWDKPALLELWGKPFRTGEPHIPNSTVFAKGGTTVKIDDIVWHPSPFSLLARRGKVKELGRVFQGISYDVTTPIGTAGSGGGGVFTEEGICLGMVMRGTEDSVCLILPSWEIHWWAHTKGVAWAIDPSVPMPSEEELKKIPIED